MWLLEFVRLSLGWVVIWVEGVEPGGSHDFVHLLLHLWFLSGQFTLVFQKKILALLFVINNLNWKLLYFKMSEFLENQNFRELGVWCWAAWIGIFQKPSAGTSFDFKSIRKDNEHYLKLLNTGLTCGIFTILILMLMFLLTPGDLEFRPDLLSFL